MPSTFAVNYSYIAAQLWDEGHIQVDTFKCPAWPDLIAEVRARYPFYVHCPLRVGTGTGHAIDTETHLPADWDRYTALLAETPTAWVSLHLGPGPQDHPGIPPDSIAPQHVARVQEALIRDVAAVVAHFGPEQVIVENLFSWFGHNLRAATLPGVIRTVADETGCGFLLDLSHARLAARELGMAEAAYIAELPVDRIRELHVTGLQCFDEIWVERARRASVDAERIRAFSGGGRGPIDHLPMTADDWPAYDRAIRKIRTGAWATPEIIAFEYGGVGGVFQAITDEGVLLEQVPRLYRPIARMARRKMT